ncbi:MAG: DUF2283 domain-containing protein [archaeon]
MEENMSNNFEYNSELDSLYIYGEKAKDEPVLGSLVFENLVFDIGTAGSFVGIEVDNASKLFGVAPKVLSKITNARTKTNVRGKVISLSFMVQVDKKEYNYSYMAMKDKVALTC